MSKKLTDTCVMSKLISVVHEAANDPMAMSFGFHFRSDERSVARDYSEKLTAQQWANYFEISLFLVCLNPTTYKEILDD